MIVIDDFIKDKELLKDLNDNRDKFFEDTYFSEGYHHDVNWWKGWWMDEAKNKQESLIEYIIKDNNLFRDNNIIKKIKGFEYWTHIHSKDSSVVVGDRTIDVSRHLGWHTNKDEVLHYNENKFKHPMFSIIFWPFEQEVEGGYLEMSSIRQMDKEIEIHNINCSCCEQEEIDFEVQRLKPKYNRLVVQDTSYWHRVTNVKKGTRWTFVVDVWEEEVLRKI